ncbi:hypothetical protein BGX28_009379 [Mortierella sp. GBA30]|nr:hypothetical protein BGX28_009379 [Mortierella sp. GBA30]
MGALEERRLRDAVDYLHEADKNTQRGWFRKPDWDIAAQYYEKAGQAFKGAKSYEQAIQAFIKASHTMISATSLYMAGKAMENGANIALQNLGQPERAAGMYKQASDLYMQNMTPDRAAEMLEKSAKAIESVSVDSAIELYIGACNIYEDEDRARYATDTFKRTISLLVKHRRFEKATEVLQRLGSVQQNTPNKSAYYKTLLSIIIIQLAAGDEVDAGKRFQAFCSSEESSIAHAMLVAFEYGDQAYYNQTASRQHVGFLDNEIARLARNIMVSDNLNTSGGYDDPSQPPTVHNVYQPSQQQQHQQPFKGDQKDTYQARPDSGSSNYQLQQQHGQRPDSYGYPPSLTAGSVSGGYDVTPPSERPPPYSDEREESEWRALTEKPSSEVSAMVSSRQDMQQETRVHEPRQQQQGQQQATVPSRPYYQDRDDEDGLL